VRAAVGIEPVHVIAVRRCFAPASNVVKRARAQPAQRRCV